MTSETFSDRSLTIELEDADVIRIIWRGKSTARDPSQFVLPVLQKALTRAADNGKQVVIDFHQLEYMNSSTITPLIRVLDQAKRGTTRVRVVYRQDLKWQALSFTALQVFKTTDGRVEIVGT